MIVPMFERFLVEPIEEKGSTENHGIILPDKIQDRLQKGRLVTGPNFFETHSGQVLIPLQKNDVIYFEKGTGIGIRDGDTQYLLLTRDQIVAKEGPNGS